MTVRRRFCGLIGSLLLLGAAPAVAQSSGNYVCVGGIKAGTSCNPAHGSTDCAFCDKGAHQGVSCRRASDCAPDGACRGTCENVPNDPVGSPQRYSMFRDDQLWITSVAGDALNGNWAETDTNLTRFTATSIGSGSSFADSGPLPNTDIAETRGRFRDAKSDRVLLLYKVMLGTALEYKVVSPNAGAEPSWQQSGEPGGAIPPYTFVVPTHDARSPAAIAAGDLDRVVGGDGFFHDEAVIAFEAADHGVQVRVLDYNHSPGTVTVTSNGTPIGTLASWEMRDGPVVPGSLAVGIGDFDGDLTNEVAVLWQRLDTTIPSRPSTRLQLTILRYVNTGTAAPHLDVIKPSVTFSSFFDEGSYVEYPSLDLVTGDFDGDFVDELAFSYIGDAVTVGTNVKVVLKVMGLDTNFNQNRGGGTDNEDYTQLPTDSPLPLGMKPRIAAGLFRYDPVNDFGISRRQLALLWWGDRLDNAFVRVWDVVNAGQGVLLFEGTNNIKQPLTNSMVRLPGRCELGGFRTCYSDRDCENATSGACRIDYSQAYVPRLSLTAGNFRGGDPSALNGAVPLWQLAAGYSSGTSPDNLQGHIELLGVNNHLVDNRFVYPTQTAATNTELIALAYDRNGKSVYVGPPVLLTVNQLVKTDLIVQEPPKHCDWFGRAGGGEFVNITRLAGLAVVLSDNTMTTYSTTTTTGSDWTIGGSIGVTVGESLEEGVSKVESGTVSDSASLTVSGSFTEKNEDYSSRSQSYEFNVTSATTEDDLIGGSYRTIFIWRYPILGFALTDNNGQPLTDPTGKPLQSFYEIALPGQVGQFQPSGGLNFDWYQPMHENGNVLSYPEISPDAANPVAIPDLGTYSLPGDMACSNGAKTCSGGANEGESCQSDDDCPDSVCAGKKCLGDADCRPNALSNATCDPAPKRQALLNTSYFIDANTQTISLNISSSVGGGAKRMTSGKLAEDLDVNVSANVTAGVIVEEAMVNVAVDVDINNENSWSKLRESTHETTSSMAFQLSKNCGGDGPGLPCNDPSQAYQAATAYYYTPSGTQKVMHAVDLGGSSSSGRAFWFTHYGGEADPALNLPQRIILVTNLQSGDVNIPNWNDSLYHQKIRGFFVLHGDDPNNPALTDTPFASAVVDGDKVKFQVRVYNYSLDTAAPGVNVLFVAVPVDPSDNHISGLPVPLCTVGTNCPTISLGPLDVQTVTIPWDTTGHGPSGAGSQLYRIFVILDPDCKWHTSLPCGGFVDEIHEWQDRYNFPPRVDGTKNGARITDPFTGGLEALESGQNNQGFGEIAVYARSSGSAAGGAPSLRAEPAPPDVSLSNEALAARLLDGTIVSDNVTAPVDRVLPVRVQVAADGPTPRRHHILLYDGDPDADGQVIGSRSVLGIDHANSSFVWFDWLPRRVGEHQLYARVLEHNEDTQPGNHTTALIVDVVDAGPPTGPSSNDDDDGCAITRGGPGGAWMLILGLTALVLRRRRHRL